MPDIKPAAKVRAAKVPTRTHHLSLAHPESHHHIVTLAFRDALRADPALAERYGSLKRGLAARFPRDRLAYLEGKSTFVAAVLARQEV
jgi:GrpB-like predicted nucleotidyltransferase (UPF0157 family)